MYGGTAACIYEFQVKTVSHTLQCFYLADDVCETQTETPMRVSIRYARTEKKRGRTVAAHKEKQNVHKYGYTRRATYPQNDFQRLESRVGRKKRLCSPANTHSSKLSVRSN